MAWGQEKHSTGFQPANSHKCTVNPKLSIPILHSFQSCKSSPLTDIVTWIHLGPQNRTHAKLNLSGCYISSSSYFSSLSEWYAVVQSRDWDIFDSVL